MIAIWDFDIVINDDGIVDDNHKNIIYDKGEFMSNRVAIRKQNLRKSERSITESVLLLFPLFLIVIVLPLIVKMHTYHSGLNVYDWFSSEDTAYDFFLFYKQWFFVGICGLIILIIVGRALFDKKTLKFSRIFLPIGVYSILVVLSTLFSEYKSFGIKGNFEQFENIFCLLGYGLVAYYTFLVIQSQKEVKLLLNALTIGILIVSTIGMFQSIGIDFFATDFGKSLIIEKGLDPDGLTLTFGKGRSYATLYNPNYVGVFSLMAISLYSVLLIFSKKIYEYILYYMVIVTAAFSMFGSQFKAGLVYLAVVLIFMIVLLRKQLRQRWYILGGVIVTMSIAFMITNNYSDGSYTSSIKYAFNDTAKANELTQMDSSEDGVFLKYKGNGLSVLVDEKHNLSLVDDNRDEINYLTLKEDETGYIYGINDMRFADITVGVCNVYVENWYDFFITIGETNYIFKYDEARDSYLYFNRYGKYSPISTAESFIFDGRERFGSGRGYIWSRSLPLLKNYILLGSGADSFIQAFPQYDYISMSNFGFGGQLITKPHCLYIQIGVQTGLLSLISFLIFFAIYAIQSMILYFKDDFSSNVSKIGLGIFLSVIAFLLGGVSNDSIICVSPVFWVIVGLGLVCNHMTRSVKKA